MKKIAILGTKEDQHPLIKRAKELGFETHVFGWKIDEVTDRVADFYHEVNIVDHELLWQEINNIGAVGVCNVASELAMHSMNYVLRKMGIPCNSLDTETKATDKYLMRKAMMEAGIDGPMFIQVENGDFSEDKISDFEYPLIIKPVDESSSRGVIKVESSLELAEALEYARRWSKVDKVIIEEFIDGPEYSGDSIAYKGEYKLLAITEKRTTGAPHFIERGHKQPAVLEESMKVKIEETLYKAFASLGIEYGAIHPEFRITADGKVKFMEIAARMGGDFIGSELVRLSTGYDYLGMIINIGCGLAPSFEKINEPAEAEIRFVLDQDDLNELERIQKEEPEVLYRYSKWREISDKPILQNPDRAGYFITVRK